MGDKVSEAVGLIFSGFGRFAVASSGSFGIDAFV